MKTEELKGIVTLDLSKAPDIPADHKTIEATARAFLVTNEESYSVASQMIQGAAANIAKVEAFFESDKTLAHRLHKSICDKISTITAPWRSVRVHIEPKMRAYRQEQERQRREAEGRARREAQEAERKAREEAARIEAEAKRQADELRRAGEMRLAREAQERAQQEAQTVVAEAEETAALGVILPETKPVGGPSEARPWEGEVTDMRALCRAIGGMVIPDALKTALLQANFNQEDADLILQLVERCTAAHPLEYMTPVRGQGDQPRPLVVVDQSVLNNLAKRLGREDLGIPGVKGTRGLQLRFSGKATTAVAPRSDGW